MFRLPNVILKLFTKLFSNCFDTNYFIIILHNMCPEIIIMSTMTQALFNSGDEK